MWKPIFAVALSLMGVTSAPAAAAASPELWRDCGDGVQCAQVTVPADWARPAGATITVGLGRLPAHDPATRQGSLVVNLGGPGEQIAQLPYLKSALADLTQWFDVVLFDPRGFGRSTPVTCPVPSPQEPEYVFGTKDRFDRYRRTNHEFGAKCTAAAGVLAGTLNSWQVARDMEAIRSALGEPRLNYYGNSYGTMFGQAYAEFFPQRAGRMYLDSVIDHTTRSVRDWLTPKAESDERNLHRFAAWCATDRSCALHGTDVVRTWDEVLARAPIPTASGGTVSVTRIVSRAFFGYQADWPDLAEALKQAHAGDATKFTVDVGARDPDLSRIMFCADFPYPTDYREVKALESGLREVAPHVGWRQAWPMANHCAGLPRTRTFPQHPFRAAIPALVVNGDYDVITPPADGRRVAAHLRGARYLQVPAGHAVYLVGNPCVRGHVHRYLSTGELPPAGTVCPEH
nr:alpha/beta hydrolase [Kibdelosporangium sp. MJ126-NF4]CEL21770.1 possible proteinase [Kibdelosporangium sp. MJ126-NF4]CTQ92550.1 possible proteinase [Kibdelosporangium sp. MJ126-NF4]